STIVRLGPAISAQCYPNNPFWLELSQLKKFQSVKKTLRISNARERCHGFPVAQIVLGIPSVIPCKRRNVVKLRSRNLCRTIFDRQGSQRPCRCLEIFRSSFSCPLSHLNASKSASFAPQNTFKASISMKWSLP